MILSRVVKNFVTVKVVKMHTEWKYMKCLMELCCNGLDYVTDQSCFESC